MAFRRGGNRHDHGQGFCDPDPEMGAAVGSADLTPERWDEIGP